MAIKTTAKGTKISETKNPHVIDRLGAGENRMTNATDVSKNRFRKRYRGVSEAELLIIDAIKDTAAQLEFFYELLGQQHEYIKEALMGLETSVMYGVKQATGSPMVTISGEPITLDQAKRIVNRARRIKAN
jgi:hypothetical protein